MSIIANVMQNLSTVFEEKKKIFYFFAKCSPVLAIDIPCSSMFGLVTSANILAKNDLWSHFCVFFICSVCVVTVRTIAYVPCWSSVLYWLLKCSEQMYRYTWWHTNAKVGPSNTQLCCRDLMSVVVLFHVCVKVIAWATDSKCVLQFSIYRCY